MFWGLSAICRVHDIEAVETNYKVISFARKEGKLVDEIPEYVQEACELLIANYQGDFLESLIRSIRATFVPGRVAVPGYVSPIRITETATSMHSGMRRNTNGVLGNGISILGIERGKRRTNANSRNTLAGQLKDIKVTLCMPAIPGSMPK